jgi:hypothetical protein
VMTEREFFEVCTRYLDHEQAMSLIPFPLALKTGDVMAGAQD